MSEERTFKCACCKEIFPDGWTESEALEEKERFFPGIPLKEMVQLCDDCHEAVMAFHEYPGFIWNEEKHRPIRERCFYE